MVFQTQEKQTRIDSLLKQLRGVSCQRALVEHRLNPKVKDQLQRKIAQRQAELTAHEKQKPAEVPNPAASASASQSDKSLPSLLRCYLRSFTFYL